MKTIKKILLILSLLSPTSLSSAAEGEFKIVTKIIVLPAAEFAAKQKFEGLITHDEMEMFMRDISNVEHAKLLSAPSIVMPLKKTAQIEMVTDKKVRRIDSEDVDSIGQTITYRLDSIDRVLKLEGIFKHSEINEGGKTGDVAINTEEMIFSRICELNKSILISKGDTHIFISLTKSKE